MALVVVTAGALAGCSSGGGSPVPSNRGSATTPATAITDPGSTAPTTPQGTGTPGTTIDRAAQPGGGAAAFEGTVWVVVPSSLGAPIPAGTTFAVRFDGGRVTGRGACNGVGGDYQRDGSTLRVGQLQQTLIGCDGNDAETALGRALEATRTYDITGATLRLRDGAGEVVLELEAGDPALLPG